MQFWAEQPRDFGAFTIIYATVQFGMATTLSKQKWNVEIFQSRQIPVFKISRSYPTRVPEAPGFCCCRTATVEQSPNRTKRQTDLSLRQFRRVLKTHLFC